MNRDSANDTRGMLLKKKKKKERNEEEKKKKVEEAREIKKGKICNVARELAKRRTLEGGISPFVIRKKRAMHTCQPFRRIYTPGWIVRSRKDCHVFCPSSWREVELWIIVGPRDCDTHTDTHIHSRLQPISHFDCEALRDRTMEGEGR